MKNNTKIKRILFPKKKYSIKIYVFVVCLILANNINGQETSTARNYSLDLKLAKSFLSNADFGIAKINTGNIQVEIFDKEAYDNSVLLNKKDAFLYGFNSGVASSPTTLVNNPYGINGTNSFYCKFFNCQFANGDYNSFDNSNDLKSFKKALYTRAKYKSSTSNGFGFYSVRDGGTLEVVVEFTFTGGAKIQDIKILSIPGLREFDPNDTNFITVDIYRGSSNTFVQSKLITEGTNLDVYEADSLVFRTSSSNKVAIKGLTDTSIARWAGESIYMAHEITEYAHKPFLFFDSNVHGIKMRRYPKEWSHNRHRYPTFKTPGPFDATQTYYWIANRRRDYKAENLTTGNNIKLSPYKDKADFGNKDFPNQNKFSGDSSPIPVQRNNQKEGLNIEILDAFANRKKAVAGLDPDELIYKDYDKSKINVNEIGNKNFTYVSEDKWKIIDKSLNPSINSPLKTSYQRIGKFIDNENYIYNGHEILDDNLFIHSTKIENIDNTTLNYGIKQPMFNNKRPIIFNPNENNRPITYKSEVKIIINESLISFNLAVLSPLEGKRKNVAYDKLTDNHRKNPQVNFYGIIDGPTFVSRFQKNVTFTAKNLPDYNDVPGKFYLVYSNEDTNGFIKEQIQVVTRTNPSIVIPEFGGGGYHEVTLKYQRNKQNNTTPVIIAGKELIDVDLRFIFSPDEKDGKDFSLNPNYVYGNQNQEVFNGNARLNENKGSGNRWFLSNKNPDLAGDDNYGIKHGYEDHNVVRTYTLNSLESIVLSVLDADPHSFTHYSPDWYLSERRLSKRITDNELANSASRSKIIWYAAKNSSFTQEKKLIGYGKNKRIVPSSIYSNYNGAIFVKAEFNNTSKIEVKINVKTVAKTFEEIETNANQNIGDVKSYPLSVVQFDLFKKITQVPATKTRFDYRIFAIQNLLSTYEYGHESNNSNYEFAAPRYSVTDNGIEVGEHARFSPKNNFDARFEWKFIKNANLEGQGTQTSFDRISYNFSNASDPYLDNWFPKNWIRHLDGLPQTPEIPSFGTISNIKVFNENQSNIESYNNSPGSLYEPWQVRLPWIAQTGLNGYRTRWNIKTIFDIDKLFNKSEIGEAYRTAGTTALDYHQNVNGVSNGDKILPGYTNLMRERQEFFWHLKSGRMVIVENSRLQTENANLALHVVVTNNARGKKTGNIVFKGVVNPNDTQSKTSNTVKNEIPTLEDTIVIFPNSSKDGVFNVVMTFAENKSIELELSDVLGKTIFKKQLSKIKGTHKIKIGDGLNIKKGMYILKVTADGLTEIKKLLVE